MRRTILILVLAALAAVGWLQAQASGRLEQAAQLWNSPVAHPHGHGPHQAPPPLQPEATVGVDATSFDATSLGSPVLLSSGWRVGISSDPAAASPTFDDSAWSLRNATAGFADVAEPERNQANAEGSALHRLNGPDEQRLYAWFRLHVELPKHHGPLAILVELPVSHNTSIPLASGPGFELYLDGKLIQPEGAHGEDAEHFQQISRIYPLNLPADQSSAVVAIRTLYLPVGLGAYTNFFNGRKVILGDPRTLNHALQNWQNRVLFERIPRLVVAIVLVVLAIFLLALYASQRGHREYLWLALHELAQAPIAFCELAGSTARLDSLWYSAALAQLTLLSAALYFEFLVAFLGFSKRRRSVRALRYSSPLLLAVGPAILLIGQSHSAWIVLLLSSSFSTLWLIGWLVFVVFTLAAAALKRNFEAALLLLPLVLNVLGGIEPIFTVLISDMTGHPVRSPFTFEAGPIPIPIASIADCVGIFVIILIIFFRFQRIQRAEERASSELAAASSVQELIIPREKPVTPGYEVDSVYEPANEVGGDFYYVEPLAGGGLLAIVGDVAGKGLQAAMNVSMLLGALRQMSATRNQARPCPSALLSELNRVLTGSESFTTCLAACFGPDGELALASAGHLPPYLNSQEVAMPGGFPLGVAASIQYEEVHLFLHPGDRLLMLSDGVVEARRPNGELFGFERVQNLSNQSAFYLADAAKSYGQEDDITVLSIRRH